MALQVRTQEGITVMSKPDHPRATELLSAAGTSIRHKNLPTLALENIGLGFSPSEMERGGIKRSLLNKFFDEVFEPSFGTRDKKVAVMKALQLGTLHLSKLLKPYDYESGTKLTTNENNIALALVKSPGASYGEIGEWLGGLQPITIKDSLSKIRRKLHTGSNTGIMVITLGAIIGGGQDILTVEPYLRGNTSIQDKIKKFDQEFWREFDDPDKEECILIPHSKSGIVKLCNLIDGGGVAALRVTTEQDKEPQGFFLGAAETLRGLKVMFSQHPQSKELSQNISDPSQERISLSDTQEVLLLYGTEGSAGTIVQETLIRNMNQYGISIGDLHVTKFFKQKYIPITYRRK